MALVSTLGGGSSTLGNVQPGLGGPYTTFVRNTYLSATLAGVTLSNVISARVSLGLDLAVSEAQVVLASEPSTGSYDDTVTITMGAGTNNVRRFTGLLKQYERGLFPREITLVCQGNLSKAANYKPFVADSAASAQLLAALQSAGVNGLLIGELMGSNYTTAADEDIVFAILQRAGVSVDQSKIGGTGTDLMNLPPDATTWPFSESALSRIHTIDAASQGYRTFESINGVIYRAQIKGWPGNQTPQFTFTEGQDISRGKSTRTMLEFKNVVRVDGYNFGAGVPAIVSVVDESGGGTEYELDYSTPLAGHVSGAGAGFATDDIANYLIAEWNRELVRVTLTTPRDDVIGPGQTHLVQGPGGTADRLHVGEPLWVQRVDIEVDSRGTFRQTMTYLGGGVADGIGPPIDWENA